MRRRMTVLVSTLGVAAASVFFYATPAHAASNNVVVNEVATFGKNAVDEPVSTNDFVELRNQPTASSSIPIGGYQVQLISAANTVLQTVTIPAGTTLAPGAFWVLGHSTGYFRPGFAGASQTFTADIPVRGSVRLLDNNGAIVDALGFVDGLGPAEGARATKQTSVDNAASRNALSTDTDNNNVDFQQQAATPGAP